MAAYDPNDVGVKNGHIFSLPHQYDEAEIILLPVPWDATVSYKEGTCHAPKAILEASSQLDFYHPSGAKIWDYGVYQLPENEDWKKQNKLARNLAKKHIESLEQGALKVETSPSVETVNEYCENLKNEIKNKSTSILEDGKLIGLVGGDHSCPLGLIEALSEKHEAFGILQIDAHADLRETYEHFTYSHASMFYNSLKFSSLKKLIQVSVRDVAPKEVALIENQERIETYFDWELKKWFHEGKTWKNSCEKIIENLPEKVYISFDIDGLSPSLCPNTGTPVPGGLSFEQAIFLIETLVASKRQIIGFDLCEVGVHPNTDWDANVGARILFHLCTALHNSNI